MWIETSITPAAISKCRARFIPRKRGMWIETKRMAQTASRDQASSPGNGGCGLKQILQVLAQFDDVASSPGNGGCGLKQLHHEGLQQVFAELHPPETGDVD